MFDVVSMILAFYIVILPGLLLTAPLTLCFIRFLNETWLDAEWRAKRRSHAEQAALLDWEASIKDFHHQQSALPAPSDAEKSAEQKPDHRIQPHGPSAFQVRRRRF